MNVVKRKYLFHPIVLVMLILPGVGAAQCPEVFDFYGNLVDNPYWYSCSGADFSFNLQSPDDWGQYEIDWGDGTPVDAGASWNSPDIINHVYTATVDTFVVTVTEINSGCVIEGVVVMEESTSASIQIPVGGLTQSCAPEVMEFINSSTNVSETTTFTWDFGDGSPPITFDYTNWGETVAHLYDVGTVDCETEVSLTAQNYCNQIQGGASEATFNPIRIWDLDEAAITASATILCYPDTVVDLTNTTERNCLFQGNIFQRYEYWNFGDYWGEGNDSIVDWTPWPPTFPYTIAYPGIGTYEVMMLDSNYCGIDTATITIQIVPPPTADITHSDDTICVGEPVTFFQNATGGADSYTWNFDDGVGWLPTGGGNITYVYNTPGTYNVCSAVGINSASGGCADTACVPVTVLPSPVADFIADPLTGCDSILVNYTDQSTGAVNWDWTFDVDPFSYAGSDPPDVSYVGAGNYVTTLTVEGLNGCLDTKQEVIQVFNQPVPDMIANNVCNGEEATFTDLSTSDPGDPILSWTWDFGDNNTSSFQHPTHTYGAEGTYDVTLTVNTASCSSTEVFQVTVEPAPTAAFSFDPTMGCSPLEVQFTNESIGGDSFTWNFGDGNASPEENPVHTFQNLGTTDTTYQIVLTAMTAFGCGNNDTLEITVMPGAQASFTDNSNPPSCAPFDAIFTNTSIGASSYLWDFGDGSPTSTAVNPTHYYENETGFLQNFQVTLIAYADNGCNDTTSSNVTVYPTADWSFSVWPDSGCSPLIVTMPFIQGINQYEWDFGDGTPVSNFPTPTHIFENFTNDPIVYDITLVGVSGFGCADTATSSLIVNPQPTSQFTADVSSGCSPLDVTFENLSIQADLYTWIYAPGDTAYTTDPFHSHTFTNETTEIQTFNVTLIAESDDGCTDEFVVPIEVYPDALPGFAEVEPGCSPYQVEFENTSPNGTDFNWEFGNGLQSIDSDPSTIFVNNGMADTTYNVCVMVSTQFGCTDTYCDDVIVHPSPTSDFTMSTDEACDPAPVDFTNLSSGGDTFEWIYGDGNSAFIDDPTHTYLFESIASTSVEYQVTLITTSDAGCSDEMTLPFTIHPEVVAALTVDSMGCSPFQAFFGNQSIGASSGFEWDFADGGSTSQTNPTHTFVNSSEQDTTFNVQLVASSIYGCTDTTYVGIEVFPTPIANAEIDTTLGCYPLDVVFQNASSFADSYTWVYGTGATSDTDEEFHTFTYYNFSDQPVTYDISLIAETDEGCNSTDYLTIDVLPQLQAAFVAEEEDCSPFEVSFENQSIGALSYQWDFGDGNEHTIENPTHTFYNDTDEDITYTVELVAQSFFGCYDTTYFDITVFPVPFADFSATPESQTFPDATIDIVNETIAGTASYEWDMDDGNDISGPEPGTYTYDSWGTYEIELIVDNGSCSDTTWQTVEILPPPPVAGFTMEEKGCAPLTVLFESNSQYAASHEWDFGNGGTAFAESVTYTYYQPGIYNVTLTVQGFGPDLTDTYTIEQAVEVLPVAVAAFTVTPTEVYVPGQPVYGINLSQNADSYVWEWGDGETSTEENPIHNYQSEGWFDVTLIANNEWNCPDTMTVVDAVHAIALGDIEFPNAFTPNGTNPTGGLYDPTTFNNDIFYPQHYGVTDYKLQIFNKWGELLFESNDVNIGWDGYYQGQVCKEDVYVWKAQARFSDGTEVIEAGDVTLLVK